MDVVRDWWWWRIERRMHWSFVQAFLGLNIFFVMSYTFQETVLDPYAPDAATLLSSVGAGVTALVFLSSTHLVRSNPLRVSASMVYQLLLTTLVPAVMVYGQRAPVTVILWVTMCSVVLAIGWRKPARKRGDNQTVPTRDLEALGIDSSRVSDIESDGDTASAHITKANLALQAWDIERNCLIYIALAYISSALHLIPQPLLLVCATAILFLWLNAPMLLPPGMLHTVAFTALSRLFHIIGAFNLEWISSSLFIKDRSHSLGSITDWDFWSPLLSSVALLCAIPLAKEGVPIDAIERILDDDKWALAISRSALVLFLITFVKAIGFWVFSLIPLLKAVS